MPVIHRLGDANTGGGAVATIPQGTVFANGILVSVNGSVVSGHPGPPPHSPPPPILTQNGCSTVRVNNIPVNSAGNADTCGHVRNIVGGDVFICSFSGGGAYIDHNPPYSAFSPPSGGQPSPPIEYSTNTVGDVEIYDNNNDDPDGTIESAPSGMQTKPDLNQQANDQSPAPVLGSPSAPPVGSPGCSVIEGLPANFNWSTTGAPDFLTWASTYFEAQLSPNFSVADLTIFTAVSYYPFTSSVTQTSGFTQKEILLNLCYLANTVLEPMLAAYGSFTITSGFRNKAGGSQHNKGQAADIQFTNFHGTGNTGTQYFERAQDIRDNINYDQMILEWFGRNPWIHVSVNPNGHRGNVLTQVARTSYQPGLIQLG